VLYLYRDEPELRVAERNSVLLREHGRHQKVLDAEQLTAVEPALRHSKTRFAGAIHDTSDATGDPQRFAVALAETCQRSGVQFHLSTTITGLATDGSSVTEITTPDGNIRSDAVVLR